ncbi:nickel-transporting atpase [Leptolyngbya sp. Heron Island J]|uniref:ABC transporter ATP-binding protein n=1 Tax=Leptolyngbya sp. Heron Island J TaxID=1385935 RepID=UPI0003B9BEC0|nr:ABC transporter ATP-binding protein [Leptolyngbya sp. Heron Island J]ESA39021.1 nickel-transporting atpase [Leptolyngbya sp. Heron Island J]
MSETILDVRNLKVEFDTANGVIKAVDGISFQVKRGRTLGIVGESGSGKSVTSLSVMGLVPNPPGRITSGEILFSATADTQPVDLCQASPKQMQDYRGSQISMIFQEPMSSLNPVYTCGFQLIEAIQQHHSVTKAEAEKKVIDRLQEVKLLPRDEDLGNLVVQEQQLTDRNAIARAVQQRKRAILKRYPHQLSGGQLQRVMIAMAMACDPALLIADEPTTALDVTVQALILDLLRDLRDRRSMSMIFITHDLGTIAEIADDVAVMYRGKIVEYGAVDQIFAHPEHPYTKGLLACRPRPEQRLRKLPTVADYMQVQDEPDGEFKIFARHFDNDEAADLMAEVTAAETASRLEQLSRETPLITVQNLKVGYPVKGVFGQTTRTFMAVDDVSFDVYKGETFGLVGESGCGKTTLGRVLLRLIEPMAGNIFFEGRNIRQLSRGEMRKLRREMQVIFQDPFSSLDPRMSIGKAIAEPLKIHKVIRSRRNLQERVAYLLERVDIDPGCVNRFPHEFSGGQRQRICIARALALNPKFIICDESVSALDVSVQAQVLNLLKELQAEFGLTYVFISHDLGVVKFMSDRIMVMNQGRLEELGPADDIYNDPQQDYTKQLISAIPAGTLERIQELQMARSAIAS